MPTYLDTHPVLSLLVICAVLCFLTLCLFWGIRNGNRHGARDRSTTNAKVRDAIEAHKDALRVGLVPRSPMRPRFIAKEPNEKRSQVMAAQILADQEEVHETPGEPTHMPAPNERGYEEPMRGFEVKVGEYTVYLARSGRVHVEQRFHYMRQAGTDGRTVPDDWAPLVAALAFEIGRLRDA